MILVTGASESNGSELIKQLSATGASVRAMVRKLPDLDSGALPGVEFVTADFDDLASVNRAIEGVQRGFSSDEFIGALGDATAALCGGRACSRPSSYSLSFAIACNKGLSGTLLALSRGSRGSDLGFRNDIHESPSQPLHARLAGVSLFDHFGGPLLCAIG